MLSLRNAASGPVSHPSHRSPWGLGNRLSLCSWWDPLAISVVLASEPGDEKRKDCDGVFVRKKSYIIFPPTID